MEVTFNLSRINVLLCSAFVVTTIAEKITLRTVPWALMLQWSVSGAGLAAFRTKSLREYLDISSESLPSLKSLRLDMFPVLFFGSLSSISGLLVLQYLPFGSYLAMVTVMSALLWTLEHYQSESHGLTKYWTHGTHVQTQWISCVLIVCSGVLLLVLQPSVGGTLRILTYIASSMVSQVYLRRGNQKLQPLEYLYFSSFLSFAILSVVITVAGLTRTFWLPYWHEVPYIVYSLTAFGLILMAVSYLDTALNVIYIKHWSPTTASLCSLRYSWSPLATAGKFIALFLWQSTMTTCEQDTFCGSDYGRVCHLRGGTGGCPFGQLLVIVILVSGIVLAVGDTLSEHRGKAGNNTLVEKPDQQTFDNEKASLEYASEIQHHPMAPTPPPVHTASLKSVIIID